jgi:hypothetical protein
VGLGDNKRIGGYSQRPLPPFWAWAVRFVKLTFLCLLFLSSVIEFDIRRRGQKYIFRDQANDPFLPAQATKTKFT